MNKNNLTQSHGNFHTHTQFCDGRAPMEQFVQKAIDLNFKYLGFTPHSPIPFHSPCNMAVADVPKYFAEVQRLRALYGDRLQILAGMEIDYLGEWGPAHPYFASLPLDFSIGSVHFIPAIDNPDTMVDVDGRFENFRDKMHTFFHGDINYVVNTFFSQMTQMVENGGFDIVGHCDKIALNATAYQPGIDTEPWFVKLVTNLIDAIMDQHLIIEINTKAYNLHHRFFPNARYFPLLQHYNAPILFNSDAHEPELLNAGREEVYKLFQNSK